MTLVQRDEIPDGWTSAPLKSVARLISGGTPDTENESYWANEDGENWVAIGDMSGTDLVVSTEKAITVQGRLSARLVVGQPGTVLFAMYASVGAVSTLGVKASWNQAILGIEPIHARSSPKYLAYSLIASRDQLPYLYRSNTQNNLNASQVGGFRILVPPLDEQRQIAEYLDRETGKIDELIAKQEQLVDALSERRHSLVNRSVTGGIDVETQVNESSRLGLSNIPKRWSEVSLVRVAPHRVDYRGATPIKTETGVQLVTARNVKPGWIDYETSVEFIAADSYDTVMRRGLPEIGDVLLTMEAPLGNVALVDRMDVAFAQRVIKFRLKPELAIPEFMLFAMNSNYFQQQLQSKGTGSTAIGLKASKLVELIVALPPVEEQKLIAEYLASETRKMDLLMQSCRQLALRLRERRAALISAAVTGKIDVRGL